MHMAADGPSVTDWIQASAGIVSALGTVAAFGALWISIRQQRDAQAEARRARLVPPAGLQALLARLEDRFRAVIHENGKPNSWFMKHEQRQDEQLLAVHSGLIADDELDRRVEQARVAYDECHVQGMLLSDPEQRQAQIDAARRGRAVALAALDRANVLVRAALPGGE